MAISNPRDLAARLAKIEAAEAKASTGDVRQQLVQWRYAPARIYNHKQLQELAADDDLAGDVANGLLRIKRYASDAPRIDFNGETELTRTMASCYNDPLTFCVFAFQWGSDAALKLVPLPDSLREVYDVQHGLDEWACRLLNDIGAEVTARPFDRVTSVTPVRMAVASGHSIGKTMLMSLVMLWAMSTRENCRGVATSTTSSQLATRLWPELLTWLSRSINRHWFDTLNARGSMRLFHVEHPNTWRFDASTASPDNAEAFQGLHNASSSSVFLLDEASGIDARIWRAIEGSMVDGAPIALAVGNPVRRDGEFHNVFTELAHRWNTRHIDSRQAHLTNRQQIADWVADWGEDSDFVRCRVAGLFPNQSVEQFISSDVIEQAMQRDGIAPKLEDAVVLGVDPARFGGDASVIATRIGRNARAFPLKFFRGLDTSQLAMRVAAWANELRRVIGFARVFICVDGVGVGAGVVDTLRSLGFDVVDVQAAGRASDARKYTNIRAELYGLLRDWLINGGAIEQHEDLAADLSAADFFFDKQGRIQLESKDAIRARLGRSPDRSDALALTLALEPAVALPSDAVFSEYDEKGRLAVLDFNPYASMR